MKKTLLTLSVGMLLAGCGDSPPKTIQETSRDITKVSEVRNDKEKILVIDIKPSSGHDNSSFFFMASMDIAKVASSIMKNFPDASIERFDFIISTGLSDKYGNSKTLPIIGLSVNRAELAKYNFKERELTDVSLLRLAHPAKYLHPSGKKIISDYCKDASNAESAADFCQRSL